MPVLSGLHHHYFRKEHSGWDFSIARGRFGIIIGFVHIFAVKHKTAPIAIIKRRITPPLYSY